MADDGELSITRLERDEIFLHFAFGEVGDALRALDEADRLAAIRVQRAPGVTVLESATIIAAVRYALHLAGSVSRIFWPPRNRERGEHLRKFVGVPGDHGLKDRRLRDHIEHLDERLDKWTAESPRPFTTVQMVVHEIYAERTRRAMAASTLVIYDAANRRVSVMGELFDLAALRRDLFDLQGRLSEAWLSLYPDDSKKMDVE